MSTTSFIKSPDQRQPISLVKRFTPNSLAFPAFRSGAGSDDHAIGLPGDRPRHLGAQAFGPGLGGSDIVSSDPVKATVFPEIGESFISALYGPRRSKGT